MNDQIMVAVVTGVVFYGIYHIIKVFTDFLLRRKVVKAGHIDKAGILDPVQPSAADNNNQTLKWGLVALFAGAGIIVNELMSNSGSLEWMRQNDSILPLGIELFFIAAGFLTFFFLVNKKKGTGK